MANNESSAATGGASFTSLLTVLFIGLKLTGYIDWSWWWVLCPMWAPIAVLLGLLLFIGIIFGGSAIVAGLISSSDR